MALHEQIAKDAKLPPLVHCPLCGHEQRVNPGECLATGWPRCCGYTMFLGGKGP
jgi:hypothetical protein